MCKLHFLLDIQKVNYFREQIGVTEYNENLVRKHSSRPEVLFPFLLINIAVLHLRVSFPNIWSVFNTIHDVDIFGESSSSLFTGCVYLSTKYKCYG